MGIVLPKELEEAISEKVASKAYDSAEHVVAEALKLLDRRDEALLERTQKLQWLRQAWTEGEQSGEPVEIDVNEFLARMRSKHSQPQD